MRVNRTGPGYQTRLTLAAAALAAWIAGCGGYSPPVVLHVPDGDDPSMRGDVVEQPPDDVGPFPGPLAQQVRDQDLIIVHEKLFTAYFGLYETRLLADPGFVLFDNTLQWVTDNRNPQQTRVWLATFNGTLRDSPPEEANGLAVYQRLLRLGYLRENIGVGDRNTIPQNNFDGFDVVIYAHVEPVDARNVVRQQKPFLTFAAGQLDELGIGTGKETLRDFRDLVHVYNNGHPITRQFPIGPFTLGRREAILATDHAQGGVVLLTVENDTIPCENVKKFRVKCTRRDLIKMKVVMRSADSSGSQICIKVDEDCYIWIDVVGKKATATKESEAGVHPVVMGIPDCGLAREVRCP
ncbi:MAG: hypothetical protein C4547_12125 [Phycisphaerales bacterium]|nr:MAG: hypothetical protein C4547_12125 [Phycisphaerales bacterium]